MEIAHYRQPVLIFNPAAGKFRRDPEGLLQRTIAALGNAGIAPRLLKTAAAGHADDLARQAVAEGADLVLVLGGDGTINEAVQGMANSGVPLGILPGGTANVLAMELGLGSKIERAAARLPQCPPTPVALGRVSGSGIDTRYFLLMCGVGLDASVLSEVRAEWKAATGKGAYYAAGFGRVHRPVVPFDICMNGARRTCGFALISRVRNYGGDLEIATGASLRRDEFEVVLFEGSHTLRYLWYMLGVVFKRAKTMRGAHAELARSLEILSPAPVQVDGEFLGQSRVLVEIVPGALRLLVPEQYG